jgi:Amt family ammonium transporter
MSAAAAILNTNLCTAVAFMVWIGWDYMTGRKPSMIGGVNGIITGLVAITPAAGYVNGWGAIAIGVIASTIVYFALNYLGRLRPFRNVDDTLGVVYTHGFAGLMGGLLVGIFADPNMAVFYTRLSNGKLVATGSAPGLVHGNLTLLKWQVLAALFVICWSALMTFVLLKVVGVFVSLRMSREAMEIGDVAEHGHEVYPSDVPSLGYPSGVPGIASGAGQTPAPTTA